ncbi:MAG: ABC transporter permease [Bryobacteraceae bacterium]
MMVFLYVLAMRGGNFGFLLNNLVMRDFRIRYRNMSLGVFWSLLNPLVMMGLLAFIFTRIFHSGIQNFHVFALCGVIPYSFFSVAWVSGTLSVFANAALVKRVLLPREIIPISTVLANALHFLIQIGLLLSVTLASGYAVNVYWLLLPLVFGLEVIFVCGLSLATSALDVYFRDMRYVVESANTILFWLVPIFYPFSIIPERFHPLYQYNPIAAVVLACRHILMEGIAPPPSLLYKLAAVSVCVLLGGLWMFGRMKRRFADYL